MKRIFNYCEQKLKVGDQKLEIRSWRLEVGGWRLEVGGFGRLEYIANTAVSEQQAQV